MQGSTVKKDAAPFAVGLVVDVHALTGAIGLGTNQKALVDAVT